MAGEFLILEFRIMSDSVNINFNGKRFQTAKNNTVLEACREAGIYVPNVCDRPDLCPFVCHLCIVAIEGLEDFPLACKTQVAEGMVVSTETPRLRVRRRKYLKHILASHPSACLECPRIEPCDGSVCGRKVPYEERCVTCKDNERCDLQTAARYIFREGILLPNSDKDFPGIKAGTVVKVIPRENQDGYPDQSTVLIGGG